MQVVQGGKSWTQPDLKNMKNGCTLAPYLETPAGLAKASASVFLGMLNLLCKIVLMVLFILL